MTTLIALQRTSQLVLGLALAWLGSGIALAAPPTWDHIVVVIEENKSFTQVIGSGNAPYIDSLAAGGALLNSMYGITHPSQPNYLQFFSGSNQGITNNNDTSLSGAPFSTPNLGAEILAAGKTFIGYSESLPSVGYTGFDSPVGTGLYTRKHNPWVSWQSNTPTTNQLSPSVNQPFTAFPTDFSTLPSLSIVVPNNNNNMHDGTINAADTWLQSNLGAYATWAAANNSLLIVTFDEDNSASRNRIPTVFYGAHVQTGAQVNSTFTLHNLLHTLEASNGTATHAGSANDVRPIVGAFTSDPTVSIASFQQGTNGYSQATDTWIESANPTTTHNTDAQLVIDGSPSSQGLIRFDQIFGTGAGQVPLGATILSAKLSILTGSTANDESAATMSLHQLLVPFDANSTWNSLSSGITLGSEAVTNPEFALLPNTLSNWAIFDVTDSITAFGNGSAVNYGWLINPSGTDGWRPFGSEAAALGDRPVLQITYAIPEPSTVAGSIALTLLVGCWGVRRRRLATVIC